MKKIIKSSSFVIIILLMPIIAFSEEFNLFCFIDANHEDLHKGGGYKLIYSSDGNESLSYEFDLVVSDWSYDDCIDIFPGRECLINKNISRRDRIHILTSGVDEKMIKERAELLGHNSIFTELIFDRKYMKVDIAPSSRASHCSNRPGAEVKLTYKSAHSAGFISLKKVGCLNSTDNEVELNGDVWLQGYGKPIKVEVKLTCEYQPLVVDNRKEVNQDDLKDGTWISVPIESIRHLDFSRSTLSK